MIESAANSPIALSDSMPMPIDAELGSKINGDRRTSGQSGWSAEWLVVDQRGESGWLDVVTFTSDVLTGPVQCAPAPLEARTYLAASRQARSS